MNRKIKAAFAAGLSVMVILTMAFAMTGCGAGSGDGENAGSAGEEAKIDSASVYEMLSSKYPDANIIVMDETAATADNQAVEEFDYTWHCDPSTAHDEVDNAPAEYYTGDKPETEAAVYIDHEIYYYPKLDEDGFKLVNYDGEQEWVYYYTDGENDEYIFSTLPHLGNSLPADMMHSEEEAAENKVLHITKAGTYVLAGNWKGQVKVDLGDKDEVFNDENAKVTLILSSADIECSVAPGIIIQSVYECDNTWEEREEHTAEVDTSKAGATVIIADDTENTVTGNNVFRMLKTKYKDEDSKNDIKTQKKMRKTDGALYSYMTMNIDGEEAGSGSLTVNSGFEGIDSELHLNVLGGNITVNSQDDGMNVNEDNVSVICFTGGETTINAAQGAEGDGVDSNGFIRIDGGTVSINGVSAPDSALDSEDGIYYMSGKVIIDGEEQSYEAGSVFRETDRKGGFGGPGEMSGDGQDGPGTQPPTGDGTQPPNGENGQPPEKPDGQNQFDGNMPGGQAGKDFDIKDFKEKVADLPDDATLDDVMELLMGEPQQI